MQNQYIIFNEIGEMTSEMIYIHINIPLKITVVFNQYDLFTSYLQTLKNTITTVYKHIIRTNVAYNTGNYRLKRLERIMKKLGGRGGRAV
jgi:amino acid permease